MAGISAKVFDRPDETREAGRSHIDVVKLEGATAARMHAEPGWRWSDDVRPIVGGERCQALHVGYCLTGSLHVVHEDGTEVDISPGHAYVIRPGHDAWVEGDGPFEALEFQSETAESYATS